MTANAGTSLINKNCYKH